MIVLGQILIIHVLEDRQAPHHYVFAKLDTKNHKLYAFQFAEMVKFMETNYAMTGDKVAAI